MSRGDADIEGNVGRYLADRSATVRYSSFDCCNNYFGSFWDAGRVEALVDTAHLEMSCLQLGFYLASWGEGTAADALRVANRCGVLRKRMDRARHQTAVC